MAGCSRAGEGDATATPTDAPTAAVTRTPRPTPTITPEPTPPSPTVTVGNQTLDESGVLTMEQVTLPAPGWLVIYNTVDGAPDDVIGQTPLTAGVHEAVEVTVDTRAATETLFAGLHLDVGAEGVFEFPGEDEPYPNEPEAEFTVELALPQPVVEVVDQEVGQDGMITLPRVELLEPGWVLIHAEEDGQIGPIVGQLFLEAGTYSSVTMTIDWRKATPTLYAVLHEDGGEERRLDPATDLPLLQNGRPVVASFKAIFPPDILVYDQPIIDGAVTIERVISNGPGWIAVWADQEGQPSFIIGSAPLVDGLNERVTVELLDSAITTQLYAWLHSDTEPGDDFNYPGADPVVRDGGRMPRATPFRTDQVAQAIVRDQPLADDNSLSVAVVVSAANTWVAVHASADGQPGDVLGRTLVPPGISRDVVVTLDPAPAAGPVYLVLYEDLGVPESFEAPGADPVLANDDNRPIRIPFTVEPAAGE
ncbi:hypothetical protein [Promineifilum sp.]|uniref:DUF7282 domain-containing protein n=1 Tax=Promineifilum sp. TaxID=2664178 RepID=UPI0035AF42B8